MRVNVRTASSDDVGKLATLFDAYRQFYEQASDLSLATDYLFNRISRHESDILIAEDANGTAVGFCQLYPSFCSVIAAPIFVLYDLFVTPAVRKQGVARSLMLAAHAHAAGAGKARMDLATARSNVSAQRLYESLGWKRDEIFYVYNLDVKG